MGYTIIAYPPVLWDFFAILMDTTQLLSSCIRRRRDIFATFVICANLPNLSEDQREAILTETSVAHTYHILAGKSIFLRLYQYNRTLF